MQHKGLTTTSLHSLRFRQHTPWQREVQREAKHMDGICACIALFKAVRLACDVCPACGKESETQDHMRRCQEQPDVVVRKDS